MSSFIKELESIVYCIRVKCLSSILPVYGLCMTKQYEDEKKEDFNEFMAQHRKI